MRMEKKSIACIILLILLIAVAWAGEVDPFYINVFNQGKSQFKQGQFREAVESFTIAEFGMLSDTKLVTGLHFYLALAQYRLKQINIFKEIIKKIELANGWTDTNQMIMPLEIADELKIILTAYSERGKGGKSTLSKSKTRKQIGNFNLLFARGLQQINQNNLVSIKRTIKKLKKINKKDPRVTLLQGVLACKQKKYSRCIKGLLKIVNTITPALKNQVFYYLSHSYYYEKNFGQTLAFYYKVTDQTLRSKLSQVIRQVLQVRDKEIEKLSRQFGQKSMNQLLKQFPGDSYICTDLLTKLILRYKNNSQKVRQILFLCLKFPSAYNQEFILKSVAYMEQMGEIPQAIGLIEGSKYIKTKNKQGIEILYKLAELYMNKYDFIKAREYFLQVDRLQKGYRKTNFYIDRIKKIQYNK